MCGIAGAVFWNPGTSPLSAAHVVRTMTNALAHRGPDGDGLWVDDGYGQGGPVVVFGHRRLAVLDLSPAAAQPMRVDAAALTYNGEIYNFASLRQQLAADGETFQSRSDTEVVLRGARRWGCRRLFSRLRGMFAFGLWEGAANRLTLARDRFGMKPLFYADVPGGVLFASEIRALLASGLVERRLDRRALWHCLAYQAVPCPETLVEGIRALPPGHVLEITANRRELTCYWDLLDARRPGVDPRATSRQHVRRLLEDAVRSHLVSDVPVGLFLSGGLDSAAIALLMGRDGVRPTTFTIRAAADAGEHARARDVAARAGATHHDVDIDAATVREVVPNAVARIDRVSADGINTFFVAQAARAAGFKVALTGIGGDEIFGGYPSFRRFARHGRWLRRWGRAPAGVRRTAARAAAAFDRVAPSATKAAALLETDGSAAQGWPVTRHIFTPVERRRLLRTDWTWPSEDADPCVDLLRTAFTRHADADIAARISFAESRTYLHDVLLSDADGMSMAHGVELRAPFVDHALAEYVVGLPASHKMQDASTSKPLLAAALDDLWPSGLTSAPKRGFALPFAEWMRGPLRDYCASRLASPTLSKRAGFTPSAGESLWSKFEARRRDVRWAQVWLLVVLSDWIERHGLDLT